MRYYKLDIRILIFIVFCTLLCSSSVSSLRIEPEDRRICIDAHPIYLDVGVYPEISKIYVATYNPFDAPIKNLTFSLFVLDAIPYRNATTYDIIAELKHTPSDIEPHNFDTILYNDVSFEYNKPLKLMLHDLEFKLNDEERRYYPADIGYPITIHRCTDINRWNRRTTVWFSGERDISEEIIFEKLCNETFKLNLVFEDVRGRYIHLIENAHVTIDNKQIQLKTNPIYIRDSEDHRLTGVSVILPSELPTNNLIKLNLKYHLAKPFSEREKPFNIFFIKFNVPFEWLYPFSSKFYKLDIGNIALGNVYLSFPEGNKPIEPITHIGTYTNHIDLPPGFLYIHEEAWTPIQVVGEKPTSVFVFTPDQRCLRSNESKVPVKPWAILTPRPTQDQISGVVFWTSPIINGEPSYLSFQTASEPELYQLIYILFLILSIYSLFSTNRKILMYFSVYLLIRFVLPIPLVITLFDITAALTTVIYILKRGRSNILYWIVNTLNKIQNILTNMLSKIQLLSKKLKKYPISSSFFLIFIAVIFGRIFIGLSPLYDALILLSLTLLVFSVLLDISRNLINPHLLLLLLVIAGIVAFLSVQIHEIGHSIICMISGNTPIIGLEVMNCEPHNPQGILYPLFLLFGGFFSSTIFLIVWLAIREGGSSNFYLSLIFLPMILTIYFFGRFSIGNLVTFITFVLSVLLISILAFRRYSLHLDLIFLPAIVMQLLNGFLEVALPYLPYLSYDSYKSLSHNTLFVLILYLAIFALIFLNYRKQDKFQKQSKEIIENFIGSAESLKNKP